MHDPPLITREQVFLRGPRRRCVLLLRCVRDVGGVIEPASLKSPEAHLGAHVREQRGSFWNGAVQLSTSTPSRSKLPGEACAAGDERADCPAEPGVDRPVLTALRNSLEARRTTQACRRARRNKNVAVPRRRPVLLANVPWTQPVCAAAMAPPLDALSL